MIILFAIFSTFQLKANDRNYFYKCKVESNKGNNVDIVIVALSDLRKKQVLPNQSGHYFMLNLSNRSSAHYFPAKNGTTIYPNDGKTVSDYFLDVKGDGKAYLHKSCIIDECNSPEKSVYDGNIFIESLDDHIYFENCGYSGEVLESTL